MDDDRGLTMRRFVRVWPNDEPCEITIVQKSKSVWIAVGDYMGRRVEVQGRTASNAEITWRTVAHREGN
jgi:hypothetical protein